jgi:hypothetical protein
MLKIRNLELGTVQSSNGCQKGRKTSLHLAAFWLSYVAKASESLLGKMTFFDSIITIRYPGCYFWFDKTRLQEQLQERLSTSGKTLDKEVHWCSISSLS